MKKKTLAALLAALLALMLVLSACGNSDEASKEDEKSESQTEEKTDAKTDDDAEAVPRRYREQRWYDADGFMFEVDLYDEDMHMVGVENYFSDSDDVYFSDLRITDACKDIDTAEVEAIPGVVEVEVRQSFFSEYKDGPFEPEDGFYVLGYNARGEVVGMQYVTIVDGEPAVYFNSVYTTDADGNETGMKRTTGSGELLFERTDENTFDDDGNIVSKISHCTKYGIPVYQDGVYVLEVIDEPSEDTRTCEFVY